MSTHLTTVGPGFVCGIAAGEADAEPYTPGFCPACEQAYDAWKALTPPATPRAPQNAWLASAATASATARASGTISTDPLAGWRRA